jgi:hypothetical protein
VCETPLAHPTAEPGKATTCPRCTSRMRKQLADTDRTRRGERR